MLYLFTNLNLVWEHTQNRLRTLRRLVTNLICLGAKGSRRLSSKTRRLEVVSNPWHDHYRLTPRGVVINWPVWGHYFHSVAYAAIMFALFAIDMYIFIIFLFSLCPCFMLLSIVFVFFHDVVRYSTISVVLT